VADEQKQSILQRGLNWISEKTKGKQALEYTEYSTAGGAVKYVTDRKLEERQAESVELDKLIEQANSEARNAKTLKQFLLAVLSQQQLLDLKVTRVAKVYIRAGDKNKVDGKMLLHGWGQLFQSSYARGQRKLENYGTDEPLTSNSINAIHVKDYYRGLQNILFKKAQHVLSMSYADIDVTARGVQVQVIPGQNSQVDMTKAFSED
jgi:hypothetical protein